MKIIRRIRTAVSCLAMVAAGPLLLAADGPSQVDYEKLVARADIILDRPVPRPEAGLPVGNGRTGSLLWTTPTALRLQVNRVDVFAADSRSTSFPERHSDYAGGCGFLDVDFTGGGSSVFSEEATSQRLSCYDGLASVNGKGIKTRTLVWNERDVLAIEVDDERPRPEPVRINLRMLRPARFQKLNHKATSKLETRGQRLVLTQAFEEADYYCGTALVVGTAGRAARFARTRDDEISVVVESGNGPFIVLAASAASFDRNTSIADQALGHLEAAENLGFEHLLSSNQASWRSFWSGTFVRLHSADGVADEIERNYTYYLYVMASASRGKYPAKFNGMLWSTGGDTRQWGGQYWGANQGCLYNGLFPTGRWELLDPVFDMYTEMVESCRLAARQQWGSDGIFFPETFAFNGLAPLPDDIAAEMRDLYLLRKPWTAVSEKFRDYARGRQPHSSRWNWNGGGKWVDGRWAPEERGGGPYGPVTHILSRGGKVAYQFWQRYEYTLDQAWLRDRAYPVLKGVVEFYRNFPNLKMGPDGKYHLHHVNSNESVWGGLDPDEEIAAMRGLLPATIRASEILDLDAEMRSVWRELLQNLAPLATSSHPEAGAKDPGAPAQWIRALPPIVRGNGSGRPDQNTMPIWFFDLCTLENPDPATRELANTTFDGYFPNGVDAGTRVGVLSKLAVTAAMMGRAEYLRHLLPHQIFSQESEVLANRMDLREGSQTTSVQRLGRAADALHNALCQSVGAGPAEPPVIRVFPAWPSDWEASFRLLARGGFLVGSSIRGGRVEYIEIQSLNGGECRVRNPWGGQARVAISQAGAAGRQLDGELLTFETTPGQSYLLTRISHRGARQSLSVPRTQRGS